MGHPFLDGFGGASNDDEEEHPFLKGFGNRQADTLRQTTARGRRAVEGESTQRYLAQLKEIVLDPKTSEERKKSLERQIKNLDRNWTRPITEERMPGSNLARGFVGGIPKAQAGIVDLAAGAANAIIPFGAPFQGLRDWAQESMAATDELTDQQGAEGAIGDVGGQIVGGIPGYARMTAWTANTLLKVLPRASKAAQLIRAADTGKVGQRMIGQAIISLPIDALQAATMEDATWQDKAKQLGINIGANVAAAAVIPAKKLPDLKAPSDVNLDPNKAANLPGERSPEIQTKIDNMIEAGKQKEAQNLIDREAKTAQRKRGREAWAAANDGKKWTDLSTKEKKEWYKKYDENNPPPPVPVADANSNKGGMDEALDIGNKDKLYADQKAFDDDPDLVYIFGDMNGLKGINDRIGKDAGNEFILNSANAIKKVLKDLGLPERIYRFGGDELVTVVPRDQAAAIRDAIEAASLSKHGAETGNMSAEIFDNLTAALSKEGGTSLEARKVTSKARNKIPGRDAAEQALIDAESLRLANESAGQGELFPPAPKPEPPPTAPTGVADGVVEGVEKESVAAVAGDDKYAALLGRLNAGKITENGVPSGLLQLAQRIRKDGGKMETTADLKRVADQVMAIKTAGLKGADYQNAMRQILATETAPVGPPTSTAPVAPPVDPTAPNPAADAPPVDAPSTATQAAPDQPGAPKLVKQIPHGDGQQFEFEMPNGDIIQVTGRMEGLETFKIAFIGSSAGEGGLGPTIVRNIRQQLSDLTGAKRFSGERRSGANPTGREYTTPEPTQELELIYPDDLAPPQQGAGEPPLVVADAPPESPEPPPRPTVEETVSAVSREVESFESVVNQLRDGLQADQLARESGVDSGTINKAVLTAYRHGMTDVELTAATAKELRKAAGESLRQAEASRQRGSPAGQAWHEKKADRLLDLAKRIEQSGATAPAGMADMSRQLDADRAAMDAQIDAIQNPKPDAPPVVDELPDRKFSTTDMKKLTNAEALAEAEGGWDVPIYKKVVDGINILFARMSFGGNKTRDWHFKTPGGDWTPVGGNVDLAIRSAYDSIRRGDPKLSKPATATTTPDPTQIHPVSQPTPPGLETPPGTTVPPGTPPSRLGVEQLNTVPHDKPLSEMSMAELDELKDQVFDALDVVVDAGGDPVDLDADLLNLAAATKRLIDQGKAAALETTPPAPRPQLGEEQRAPRPKGDDFATQRRKELNDLHAAQKERNRLNRQTPRKMNLEDAEASKLLLEDTMLGMTEIEKPPFQIRLDEVNERIAELRNPPRTTGVVAQMPYELGSSVMGMFIGSNIGDTDDERRNNAITGLLLGAGVGHLGRRYNVRRPQSIPPTIPGQAQLRKQIQTHEQIDIASKQKGFLNRLEGWYQQVMRPSYSHEKATIRAGAKKLQAHKNPGKRSAMFGSWVSQAEEFLFGRPSIEGPDGNRIQLPARNAQEIANMAQGDTQSLGELMAAMTAIEQFQVTGRNNSGLDMAAAVQFAHNAPAHLHEAVKAARQLHLSLLDVMLDAGVISPEARVKMANEEFYAPLERVFGSVIGEAPPTIGTSASGTTKTITAPNPLRARGFGSERAIKNPFETMIANIPRVMRAAEINKAKLSMINLREANPAALTGLIDFAPGGKRTRASEFQTQIDAVRREMDISSDDAQALLSAFSTEDLTPLSDKMSVWRNGKLETWRLDPYMAQAYKSMNTEELGTLWQVLGALNQPARAGIVNNPLFIVWQSWRDNWQATQNSQYGFRWGLDWIHGWRAAMQRSPEYRNYLSGGGGHSKYAQKTVIDTNKALKGIQSERSTTLKTVAAQVKQRDFLAAYNTFVTPIIDAGRVGEYLRARGRGVSVVEAVYAAKEVAGNFQRIGPAIKGLNHATLFLNPALKSLDQAVYAAGVHPFRVPEAGRAASAAKYAAKAFLTITVPSYLMYAANEGDQEIADLRRTASGQRYWWYRNPYNQKIGRLAKPIFEGQIWGTSVEIMLDNWKETDPEAFKTWLTSVQNDAAMNLLPTAVVVPWSIWANRDFAFDSPIVPGGTEDLESAQQVRSNSSIMARVVSDALSPVTEKIGGEFTRRALSPSGIDYITRGFGGTLAGEAMKGLDIAYDYQQENYLAPASEWPIIRGALTNYPSASTEPVEKFYRDLERVERRSKTLTHLAETDLNQMMNYFDRHQNDIMKAKIYSKTRVKLADLRQGIEDVRNAPSDVMDLAEKRRVTQEMQKMMIEQARIANQLAKMF